MIYSEGVAYLAEQAGAYWLIDAIASHIVTNKELRERAEGLMFWKLDVAEGQGVLTAQRDCEGPTLVTQEIEYTDFPLDSIDIWAGFNGEGWTLYLPSEH